MAAPYSTGTVTLVQGSNAVVGTGTAWQTALIAGGTLFPEADGNPMPILSIDSNTQLTAATKWKGASGEYAYAIMRDDVVKQQIVATADALARLIQQLGSPALAALAGLQPEQDRVPFFAGPNAGALATLTALGGAIVAAATPGDARSVIGSDDAASLVKGILPIARFPDSLGVKSFDYIVNGGDLVIENDNNRFFYMRKKTGSVVQALVYHDNVNRFLALNIYNDAGAYVKSLLLRESGELLWGSLKVLTEQSEYLALGTNSNYDKMLVQGFGDFHGAGIAFRPAVNSCAYLYFNSAGMNPVGSISGNGTAVFYNTASDHRLKYDVESLVNFKLSADEFSMLDNALLRVLATRPVSFRFYKNAGTQEKSDDDAIHHGFIAHELQQALPHAVTGVKDAMEAIGRAMKPATEVPEQVLPGSMISPPRPEIRHPETGELLAAAVEAAYAPDTVIPAHTIPGDVRENVSQEQTPKGYVWEQTGERILPQVVDHSKVVADLTAAVQSLTRIVLDQKADIAALGARVADLEAV